MSKMKCYLVVLCILQTVAGVKIDNIGRRTGSTRESKKLFGGYKITPKFCKPTRKVDTDLGGPNICMFNHECVVRNGQVVGACMDGFLFGACCQIPSGVVGELMESDLQLVSHVNNNLPYKPLYTTRIPSSSLYTVNKLAVSNIPPSTHILPTAQDNGVYQVNGLQDQFSAAGVTHTSSSETFFLHQDDNDQIDPDEFKRKSSPPPVYETRKTTPRTEIMTTQYRPSGAPIIQISISNPPEYYSTQKPFTYKKPGFKPKPTKPSTEDKYVLIPTISQPIQASRPNKTQEFDSIINIIQMLNDSNTPTTYAPGSTYQYSLVSSTRKPQSTPILAETKQPPSTSYVYSSTPIPPRPTIATTKIFSSLKPTQAASSPTSLYYYPGTSPYDYIYSSTMPPPSVPDTTKKPPSTSYVFSSTVSKRPTTNGVTSIYSMYPGSSVSYPHYDSPTTTKFPTSTPTIIILGPGTSTTSNTKKPSMTQLTINNHVTHNMISTEMPVPTILITPKPGIASIKPVNNPTTDYFTSGIESETSVNDMINFPPVRNPNLNISASYLDDLTTPTFLEDEALNIKMESFVNKIVQGLQEPFQGLKEVVYDRNTPVFNGGAANKPTKKPAKSTAKPNTNTKPLVSRKPTTKKPTTLTITKKTTSKKPTTPKKVITTTPTYIETETETPTAITGDYSSVCGIRPLIKSGRIVGGKGAAFGGFPWQVLVRESTWLGLFTKNKCGGVLISNRYVMTAAHCQPGFLASLVAVFGEHDISGERETKRSLSRNVKRVIVHREYDATTFENDLALLELEHPVIFDEHIVPICLPREGEDFTGRMATVTGWGRLKYNGGVPSILQEVQVPIMENHVCQEMFRTANHHKIILDSFLCAGYANGQKDSCEGDSGGPLVLKRPDGRYQLAGTVSHGIKCAAPYLPGVYMRTAFYKPWIESITGVH